MRGSILPSEGYNTLHPIELERVTLFVQRDDEAETYHACYKRGRVLVLASHPNGHSCRSLIERIRDVAKGTGDAGRVLNQKRYIEDCGGTAISDAHLARLLSTIRDL